jgi:hypothetical protein
MAGCPLFRFFSADVVMVFETPDPRWFPRRLKRDVVRCSSLAAGQRAVGHPLNFVRSFTFRDEIVLTPEMERWGVTNVALFDGVT